MTEINENPEENPENQRNFAKFDEKSASEEHKTYYNQPKFSDFLKKNVENPKILAEMAVSASISGMITAIFVKKFSGAPLSQDHVDLMVASHADSLARLLGKDETSEKIVGILREIVGKSLMYLISLGPERLIQSLGGDPEPGIWFGVEDSLMESLVNALVEENEQ